MPRGKDRIILDREVVNWTNWNVEQTSTRLLQINKKEVEQAYREKTATKVYASLFDIRPGLFGNKLAINSPPELWQCRQRKKPMFKFNLLIESLAFTGHDFWDELAYITPTGHLYAEFNNTLTLSRGFFKEPTDAVCLIKDLNELSALWVNPEGLRVILGFSTGLIQDIDRRESGKKGPMKSTNPCMWYKYSPCGIQLVCAHPKRPDIYWCCCHGVGQTIEGFTNKMRGDKLGTKQHTSLKLSPSGAWLASASFNDGVKIWNSVTMQLRHHLNPNTNVAKAVDWHPWICDLLVTGELEGLHEGRLSVWRCCSDEPLIGRITHEPKALYTVRFHPFTGELLCLQWNSLENSGNCSPSSTLYILDGHGQVRDCSEMMSGYMTHLFFSKDGSEVIAAGRQNVIYRCQFSNFHWIPKPKTTKLLSTIR